MNSTNPAQTRQTLNLQVGEMADLCGVNRDTWYKWEKEKREPPAVAIRLFEILLVLHNRGELEAMITTLKKSNGENHANAI